MKLKLDVFPLQLVIIWITVVFIPSTGWLQEKNRFSDPGHLQLKFLSDRYHFRLLITDEDQVKQLTIPTAWLIPDEIDEEKYVSDVHYADTLTAFRIGEDFTGIHLSSYDIQQGGSAQAAAGRDVFLVFNRREGHLYPGIIDLGITKSRVRSAGVFYATNHLFLLADINDDGFKDIGMIKEELQFSPQNQTYNRYPSQWYLFKTNHWIHEPDSSGIMSEQTIIQLPLIGLGKSPVDFLKEVFFRTTICILDYEDFGVQSMAYKLLGYQWYQWNKHGDPDPKLTDTIKVAVYNNISLEKVKELYPVIKELKQDIRYVEYDSAIKYFDHQIQEIDTLEQTSHQSEDLDTFEDLRSKLMMTKEEIVHNLDKPTFDRELPSMKRNITKIAYRFEDSSVPPEYHRSYTITIIREKATISVDSYGEIIIEKEVKIKEKDFTRIVSSLSENKINKQSLGDNEGCVGGTGERLTYWDEKNEIFSASVYHCGGIDSGNLSGNIKAVAEGIKILIPNLDDLLE